MTHINRQATVSRRKVIRRIFKKQCNVWVKVNITLPLSNFPFNDCAAQHKLSSEGVYAAFSLAVQREVPML